jgi:hypothetical protein
MNKPKMLITQLTPELIRNWKQIEQLSSDSITGISIEKTIKCPVDNKIKSDIEGSQCVHNFGFNNRYFYCIASLIKKKSVRTLKHSKVY